MDVESTLESRCAFTLATSACFRDTETEIRSISFVFCYCTNQRHTLIIDSPLLFSSLALLLLLLLLLVSVVFLSFVLCDLLEPLV